jgi:hypothetical protein
MRRPKGRQDGKRTAHRKLECQLEQVIQFLKPMKPKVVEECATVDKLE